ncbi:MAG TPA: hypothetical protein ENK64_00335 [Flavobacteriales bacterium]|nr:hypothetical protein [Flavobacteriales bacterium]
MPNPPLSFLKIFKQNLADNHISIDGIQVRNALKKHKEILWQYQSKPMIELAKYTNDYSINHFSEALAWSLIQGDQPANGYLDKKAIHKFFVPYGFDSADIEDGCGLAPDNLVQPTQMTNFLSLMSKKLGQAVVLDILPHAGEEGYAKYFLKNDPVQKHIWVKSGSVSKVQNYTGIFKGQSGKYYAFSIMTNYFIGEHKDVQKAIQNLVKNYIEEL